MKSVSENFLNDYKLNIEVRLTLNGCEVRNEVRFEVCGR
jgi:hypothetical protein